jgi:uncharacterized membrane protein
MDEQTVDESQEAVPEAVPLEVEDITGVERNRLVAALSYLWVLVLIPLFFVDKDDPFVKFHARQGLVIFIGFILAGFVLAVVPIIGNLVSLVLALASIAGLIQALQGKLWKVPLVGDIADKFKF